MPKKKKLWFRRKSERKKKTRKTFGNIDFSPFLLFFAVVVIGYYSHSGLIFNTSNIQVLILNLIVNARICNKRKLKLTIH